MGTFPPTLMTGAIFPFDESGPRTTGGAATWREALAWLDDPDETAIPVEAPRVVDETPEAILAELGLNERLTDRELSRLRRLYMWRNHPDRHGESQRAGATRRVAIANMLIDRARARLMSRRRP